MPTQRKQPSEINPNQMPKETWEAVKRGLGIEIDTNKIEREAKAAKRVSAREEKTPEYRILTTNSNGVNLFDALKRSDGEGKTMPSHSQLRRIIEDPELLEQYKTALPAWTSTGIAYAPPDEELGKKIEYQDLVIEVPKEYQKSKNIAMIIPNLRIEKDQDRLFYYHVNTAGIDVVEGFPSENGWYIPDSKYAIPQGNESSELNQSALYIWRSSSQYVGAVAAGTLERDRRVVDVCVWPRDYWLGVMVRK